MLPIQWTQHYAGTRIIVDKFAYEEKVTYRAVAVVVDARRPNRVKPIYKRKQFVTRKPIAYMVKGMGLIIHPDLYANLQKQMSDSVMEQQRKLIASAFGLSKKELE